MNIESGRTKQKLQTRSLIIQTAKKMMDNPQSLTLEEVAKKASVSRATIYRYFPSIDMLFSEAAIHLDYKTPEELNEELTGLTVSDKIRHIQKYYNNFGLQNEVAYRRHLSVVMLEAIKNNEKLRGGRRVEALKMALEPLKSNMSKADWERLINATALLSGFDALVICKDVCGLDDGDAEKLLEWMIELVIDTAPKN
ncbi:MAG: AcrR family transcriptional regulator [Cryomorphaceae bacterium]|jgi:AcrR family transcriptional regulator